MINQLELNQTCGQDDTTDKIKRLQRRNLQQQIKEKDDELQAYTVKYQNLLHKLEAYQEEHNAKGHLKELTKLKKDMHDMRASKPQVVHLDEHGRTIFPDPAQSCAYPSSSSKVDTCPNDSFQQKDDDENAQLKLEQGHFD